MPYIEPKSRFVYLNTGIRLHFLDWPGSDPPIIAIHGSKTTCHMWDQFCENLQGKHRVIAPDRRGYGDSQESHETAYKPEDMSKDLAALIEELELKEFHLIGHSMGTRVGGRYALYHPQRVISLILVDTSDFAMSRDKNKNYKEIKSRKDKFSNKQEALEYLKEHEGANWPENILKHHINKMTYTFNNQVYHKVKTNVLIKVRQVTSSSFVKSASEFNFPTLILRGENSKYLLKDEARKLNNMITESKLIEIPNAGHFIVQENFDSFYEVVNRFLQDLNKERF